MATTGALRRALSSGAGPLGLESLRRLAIDGFGWARAAQHAALPHNAPGAAATAPLATAQGCCGFRPFHSSAVWRPPDAWPQGALLDRRALCSQPDRKPEEDVRTAQARERVWTLSNGISLARLASAPVLAAWILTDQWHLCLPGLAVAGAPLVDARSPLWRCT